MALDSGAWSPPLLLLVPGLEEELDVPNVFDEPGGGPQLTDTDLDAMEALAREIGMDLPMDDLVASL